MYDLRSNLAHGSYTILDSEHREKILENIGNIQSIAYDFIVRLIYDLTPEQKMIDINPSRSITVFMGHNPRNTGVSTTLDMFPNKDWKIKADWIL